MPCSQAKSNSSEPTGKKTLVPKYRNHPVNQGQCECNARFISLRMVMPLCVRRGDPREANWLGGPVDQMRSANVRSVRRKKKSPAVRIIPVTTDDMAIVVTSAAEVPSSAHRKPSITPTMGLI